MLVPRLGRAPVASIPLPVLETFTFKHPDRDVWRVLSATSDVGVVKQGLFIALEASPMEPSWHLPPQF